MTGCLPHAVIDVVVVECEEKAHDGQEDDDVRSNGEPSRPPLNLERQRIMIICISRTKKKYYKFTTGVASGALANMMGNPNAETTRTDVMKMAISRQGLVPPEESPNLLEITTGNGTRR